MENSNLGKYIFVAAPQKFTLKYRRADGQEKTYRLAPLEVLDNALVAYVFGSKGNNGVRRFKNERMIDLKAD